MKTDDEGNRYIDDPDAPPVDQLVRGNVEKIMVKLGGDAKTELKVSNQTDSQGNIDLSNITLEFKDKKYEGLKFEYEDEVEDHGSVKVLLFTAEAEDGTIFEVEVDAGRQYDISNIVDDINWRSLETFPSEEAQQGIEEGHCTEQEIAEGTCGHGVNGKIGRKPAGPSLMDFFKDE